jgi:hypothetical protein
VGGASSADWYNHRDRHSLLIDESAATTDLDGSPPGSKGNLASCFSEGVAARAGAAPQGEGADEAGNIAVAAGFWIAVHLKEDSGLLGRGRGRLTSPHDSRKALDILDERMTNGARVREVSLLLGVGLTTLQRRRR